jgi:hypothetical protein
MVVSSVVFLCAAQAVHSARECVWMFFYLRWSGGDVHRACLGGSYLNKSPYLLHIDQY